MKNISIIQEYYPELTAIILIALLALIISCFYMFFILYQDTDGLKNLSNGSEKSLKERAKTALENYESLELKNPYKNIKVSKIDKKWNP